MLGSVVEAEDVVQEALLRLHDATPLDNTEAFLTTVTTRLSIDVLRSATSSAPHPTPAASGSAVRVGASRRTCPASIPTPPSATPSRTASCAPPARATSPG